ncbi:sigma-54 interaction domain-containing protein [Oceanobacillus saliphilus]|uniref:sigma-54 interaction domain-containing protein n=1 Tax=Oceanobacillus saliphilus TaxID=2925834 RepID=UPI00201E2953|nr:sigma 54-interacting transcriptional regulator [Oceanobacillus saliphilus]
MQKELDRLGLTDDWGAIKTDKNQKVLFVSSTFCNKFSKHEKDLIGVSIHSIIHRSSSYEKQKISFATVFGHSCLIKVYPENSGFLYRILIRQEDIAPSEIVSFLNSIDSQKYKKKSIKKNRYSFEDIIGESPAIQRVKELAAKISYNNSTILLTGESGTGKELFAQAIHGLSGRSHSPFIAVNCVAIPDELFESELFGYESGAFSGAKKEGKPGKVELAQGGTLFLDEISELTYQSQGKLLRVLQEREVERLGGTTRKQVNIRIIAATNRDLKELVKKGEFREDLFFRLYVFDLQIPPLRKRKEDILQLAYEFVDYYNEKFNKEVNFIDSKLEEWLLNYHWPGNVRELKSSIERGMNIIEGDTLTVDMLYLTSSAPEPMQKVEPYVIESLEHEVRKAEIQAIQQVLKETNGDRSLAAQKLNIHIASLYRKISKYGLK